MIWAEAGVNIWDPGRMTQSEFRAEFAGEAYENFYKMLTSSCADGVFYWWYPGGYRCGENSDFGIINPDGTDREVTKVIRANGQRFIDGPSARPVDHWIEIDRDADPAGATGIYDAVKDEFWKAIEDGETPGLRTSGTGTNSANCPLLAVGNTECNGTNPPKYLDGAINYVKIRTRDGDFVEVEKGGEIEVDDRQTIRILVSVTNLGESEWITKEKSDQQYGGKGAVLLYAEGLQNLFTPMRYDIGHLETAETLIASDLSEEESEQPIVVTLTFKAVDRTPFGERFTFTLKP